MVYAKKKISQRFWKSKLVMDMDLHTYQIKLMQMLLEFNLPKKEVSLRRERKKSTKNGTELKFGLSK